MNEEVIPETKFLVLTWVTLFCGICILLTLFFDAAYKKGFEEGVRSVPPPKPQPAMTLLQKDELCSAWLFNTDLLKAKKRVCGGKG